LVSTDWSKKKLEKKNKWRKEKERVFNVQNEYIEFFKFSNFILGVNFGTSSSGC